MVAEVEGRGHVDQIEEESGCPRQPGRASVSDEPCANSGGIKQETDAGTPVNKQRADRHREVEWRLASSPCRRNHHTEISPMSAVAHPGPNLRPVERRPYYGWINLTLAALAMVGTLPGRTQGLGLITEPLLADLRIDRVSYAAINLWATLIGSLFCLPCGRLVDRFGSRLVLTVVLAALAATVLGMSVT